MLFVVDRVGWVGWGSRWIETISTKGGSREREMEKLRRGSSFTCLFPMSSRISQVREAESSFGRETRGSLALVFLGLLYIWWIAGWSEDVECSSWK